MSGRRVSRFVVLIVLLPALVAVYVTLRHARHRDAPDARPVATGMVRGAADSPPSVPSPDEPPPKIVGWRFIEDFPEEIAVFESVFWDARDTTTLRRLIRQPTFARDKTVLEIGTGSGLLSLCCLKAGARHVVATDVNAAAIANARYNADRLGVADRLETRLVSLKQTEAYAVVGQTERFDLIISNPPWENQQPTAIDEYAFYDEEFRLLRSILEDLPDHLEPGGQAYLAYGSVSAVRHCQRLAAELGLAATILDDRELDDLPEVFLPAMVIQVAPLVPGEEKS
jgi:methylase of polypeptide subunit release factors